jgi:hypothetical protein
MADEKYARYLAETEQWTKLKSYDAAAYDRLHAESTRSLKDINQRISPPTPAAVLKHAHKIFEHLEHKMSREMTCSLDRDKDLWKALNELGLKVSHQEKTIRQQQRLIDELRGRR